MTETAYEVLYENFVELIDANHVLIYGVIGKIPAERIKSSYLKLRECFNEKGAEGSKELGELLQKAETKYKEFIEGVEKSIEAYFPFREDSDGIKKTEEHLKSLLVEGKITPENLRIINDHCWSIAELFDI